MGEISGMMLRAGLVVLLLCSMGHATEDLDNSEDSDWGDAFVDTLHDVLSDTADTIHTALGEANDDEHGDLHLTGEVAQRLAKAGYDRSEIAQMLDVVSKKGSSRSLGESKGGPQGVKSCDTQQCAATIRDKVAQTAVEIAKLRGAKKGLDDLESKNNRKAASDIKKSSMKSLAKTKKAGQNGKTLSKGKHLLSKEEAHAVGHHT